MAKEMTTLRIDNLEALEQMALQKRAVVVPNAAYGVKPRAASFYLSWPGVQLLRAFRLGMFLYEKPKKKPGNPRFCCQQSDKENEVRK